MTLLVARSLATRGWTTEVWLPGGGRFADAVTAAGVEVRMIDVPASLRRYGGATLRPRSAAAAAAGFPQAWAALAGRLRAVDLVHADDHRGMLIAGPAARLARRPVLWHVHSVQRSRALNLVCSRLAHRIVVPSATVVQAMPGLGSGRALAVIANALADLGEPVWTENEGPPRLVTVGRLHPDKGLDVLLRAVWLLLPSHPELQVDVLGGAQIGHEDYERRLRAMRSDLGLDEVVIFHGFVDDPASLTARASVYVQPARDRTEVQPLAVLEAMAHGIPVVVTTAGGLGEMVSAGQTGLLVRPDDAPELAAAVDRLLVDRRFANQLAIAGRDDVRTRYDPDRFVDAMEREYETMLRP